MSDEELEEGAPRRPRVVDKRISARAASGEASPPRPAPEAASPEPSPTETADVSVTTSAPVDGPPAPDPADAHVWTPEQEAEARRMAEEIARTPSLDWIVQSAVTLANVAGTKLQMGQTADAQAAIDALSGMLEAVGQRLLDAEAPLRQTLAQLQMMYAQQAAPPPARP